MKKFILGFSLLLAGGISSFAQCGKKIVFTSSKTEYLDTTGALQNAEDEKTVIESDGKTITITPGDHQMTGTIKSDSCNWKIPYKEGKSVIRAVITDNGEEKKVVLTIEGKNGKVTLLAEVEGMMDRKIRVTADTFEEKK
jgi:hypothetical protein